MPDHWQSTTLGRVATVMTERVDPSVGPERRYLGLEHLASGNSRSVGSWGSTAEVTSSTTPFRAGDTLFGRLAAYLRKGCIAPFEGVCTPEILVLRTRGDVDSKFLGLLVLNDRVFDECIRLSAGTRMPRTSTKDLLKVAVLVPPVEEQRRIVDVVGAVDAQIDALEAQSAATRTARNAVLADLLDSPGADWRSTTLGEIVAINPESVRGLPDQASIRYVDIGSVSDSMGIDAANLESFRLHEAPSRAQRIIRAYDVIVSTVRPNLRAFALVEPQLDGEVASTGFTVLRASEATLPGYIWAVVREECFVDWLMSRVTGSNYPAVRAADIAAYECKLPPIDEQRRIVEVVGAMDEQITALESQAAATRQVRAGVLAELLSGERLLDESYDRLLGL